MSDAVEAAPEDAGLVERLRAQTQEGVFALCLKAADRIDALSAQVAEVTREPTDEEMALAYVEFRRHTNFMLGLKAAIDTIRRVREGQQ